MVTVSTRPEPGSKMVLEIEVPPDEVDRHFATAYRHVAERTKVPGFRPGKAPRHVIDRFVGRGSVLAEAIDHLVSDCVRRRARPDRRHPDRPAPRSTSIPAGLAEGQPITFTATVPVRPDVELGAYTDYPFAWRSPRSPTSRSTQVIEELREQQATLRPIDERAAAKGDIAAVKFVGTIDGEPFEGGSADRLPLVIGENRMIPGWEDQLIGMEIGATKGFDITFPDDYRVEDAARQAGALRGRAARPAREGPARGRRRVREERRGRRDPRCAARRDPRRHGAARRGGGAAPRSATGSSTSRSSNASVELPEVMVANEIEIMRDELRTRLAQQRIGMEQYLALAKQTPEELAAELREPATRRVKTLLVLSAIAEKEGVDASDEQIEAEIAEQLARYDDDAELREYLSSRRGRSYLRMTLRNRTLVDTLIERALGTDAPAGDGGDREPATSRIRPNRAARGVRLTDARPDGHRVERPRRARVRHLLAAPEGPHHLPG